MSVSISTPKAFSKRRAMSPDRSALTFRRLERVGRATPRTFAASVTERPWASMISVRRNQPGCTGFSIRMAPPLVIVLIVQLPTLRKIYPPAWRAFLAVKL
jgi:hypothetical protein